MRLAIIAALALAGCAAQSVYSGPLSPEAEAEKSQHDAAARAFMDLQRSMTSITPEAIQEHAQLLERHRQAAAICRARANLAATQPAFGGFGVGGGMAAGMQLAWAAANAETTCINTYRATGILPSY